MRLASATGFVALAILASACAGPRPAADDGDDRIVESLSALGIEGRTYTTDLASVNSIYLHKVHTIGEDLLIEDIHGHLTYVDGPTINPVWEFYGLPQTFDHAPDHTPTAIVGISDGHLFAITRDNGVTIIAPSRVGVVPSAAPVATDSTLYVPSYVTPTGSKTVYSVSLGSGYRGWGWTATSDVTANMAKGGPGGGDTFYFATTDGSIYAFPTELASRSAPNPAWTAHAKANIYLDLVVDRDDLAVVTSDARLICFDRITGNVRWEAYPNHNENAGSPAQFSSKNVFYRVGGELRAYDRATGKMAWAVEGATAYLAERDDHMLLKGEGSTFLSVITATGEVIEEADMPGVTIPSSVAANGIVHVVTHDGLLVAVEYGW